MPHPVQVSARVANELGAGDALRARSAARTSALLVVAVMLVFSAGVLAVRHVYGTGLGARHVAGGAGDMLSGRAWQYGMLQLGCEVFVWDVLC